MSDEQDLKLACLHQAGCFIRGKQRGVGSRSGFAGLRVRLRGRFFFHVPSRMACGRFAVVISSNADTNDACCGAR